MNSIDEYIFSLIAARLCQEKLLTEEEKELNDWLAARPGNLKVYQEYQELFDKKERLQLWNSIRLPEKMPAKIFHSGLSLPKRIFTLTGCAAAVLLLVLISWRFLHTPGVRHETTEIAVVMKSDIAPGKQKARLELEDGEVIALSDSSMAIHSHADIQVENGGVLQYAAGNTLKEVKAEYHTLVVERGGEFQLILPDGTKVWLNSDSELRYPSIFNKATRQVYLKGEAYFEVKHSEKQPFIVTAGECQVKVLGTEFNISSYWDEGHIATTLVKGKVAYTAGREKGELSPGQQCVYDSQLGLVTVKNVEVEQYISWKSGLFIFDHIPMVDLAKQLARWYDVEVFFPDDQARNISFTGAMERYKPVSYFIEMINETNTAECRLEGNMLVFRKK